jgi:hypothetical protein
VGDEKDFQKRVQKIGEQVQNLETIADPAVRASAKGLVQSLMDLHGTGLERILEIVFESGEGGARVIDELGKDPLVSSLLVLYGLHPEEIDVRVERKLKEIRSKVHKMGAEVKLESVLGGEICVRVKLEGHACGSTKQNVQAAVEEAVYEAAPDLTSLVIEGLEEPAATGFVALGQLMGSVRPPASIPTGDLALRGEGMD